MVPVERQRADYTFGSESEDQKSSWQFMIEITSSLHTPSWFDLELADLRLARCTHPFAI